MCEQAKLQGRSGGLLPVVAACLLVLLAACQGMDRLEPDPVGEGDAGERGTILDSASKPSFAGGRLTEEIARRRLRQIEAAPSEQRLKLAERFMEEYPNTGPYPGADSISYLHELVGDAHSELGQPEQAADAWEKAITTSWPQPDLLGLPLTNLELPYQIGWARYEAGVPPVGADWLVRTTFVDDRPQLDQGLRFLYGVLGSPGAGFEAWLRNRRVELAVAAPDFELPGYQSESVALSSVIARPETRLTLLNFWTPT